MAALEPSSVPGFNEAAISARLTEGFRPPRNHKTASITRSIDHLREAVLNNDRPTADAMIERLKKRGRLLYFRWLDEAFFERYEEEGDTFDKELDDALIAPFMALADWMLDEQLYIAYAAGIFNAMENVGQHTPRSHPGLLLVLRETRRANAAPEITTHVLDAGPGIDVHRISPEGGYQRPGSPGQGMAVVDSLIYAEQHPELEVFWSALQGRFTSKHPTVLNDKTPARGTLAGARVRIPSVENGPYPLIHRPEWGQEWISAGAAFQPLKSIAEIKHRQETLRSLDLKFRTYKNPQSSDEQIHLRHQTRLKNLLATWHFQSSNPLIPELEHFLQDIARMSNIRQRLFLHHYEELRIQRREHIQWELMHQLPFVKSIRMYRGVAARKRDRTPVIQLKEATRFYLEERVAAARAGAGEELVAIDCFLDRIEGFNLHAPGMINGTFHAEVIVEKGRHQILTES